MHKHFPNGIIAAKGKDSILDDIAAWRAHYAAKPWIIKAENEAFLTEEDAAKFASDKGTRWGVTAGCMDLMHPGHNLVFEEAERHCDKLLVCLQTDPTVNRPLEKSKPVDRLHARFTATRRERGVHKIHLYTTENELSSFLEKYARINGGFIDVRFIGEDYVGKAFTGDHVPIELLYNWRQHDYSTTKRRDLVVAAEPERLKVAEYKAGLAARQSAGGAAHESRALHAPV